MCARGSFAQINAHARPACATAAHLSARSLCAQIREITSPGTGAKTYRSPTRERATFTVLGALPIASLARRPCRRPGCSQHKACTNSRSGLRASSARQSGLIANRPSCFSASAFNKRKSQSSSRPRGRVRSARRLARGQGRVRCQLGGAQIASHVSSTRISFALRGLNGHALEAGAWFSRGPPSPRRASSSN